MTADCRLPTQRAAGAYQALSPQRTPRGQLEPDSNGGERSAPETGAGFARRRGHTQAGTPPKHTSGGPSNCSWPRTNSGEPERAAVDPAESPAAERLPPQGRRRGSLARTQRSSAESMSAGSWPPPAVHPLYRAPAQDPSAVCHRQPQTERLFPQEEHSPGYNPGLPTDEARPWPGGDVLQLRWECDAQWARAIISLAVFVNLVT